MKILIFLFAMITFILMAADPRREDFQSRDIETKKNELEPQNLKKDQDDLDESS